MDNQRNPDDVEPSHSCSEDNQEIDSLGGQGSQDPDEQPNQRLSRPKEPEQSDIVSSAYSK